MQVKSFLFFLILLLTLTFWLVACIKESGDIGSDDAGEDDADDDVEIDDDVVDDDSTDDDVEKEYSELIIKSPNISAGEYVIKTQEDWEEFLDGTADLNGFEIDFDKQMVVGTVVEGGGCAIFGEITRIWEDVSSLNFEFAFDVDGPCYCALLLPIFAIVPKTDKDVVFSSVPNEEGKTFKNQDFPYTVLFMNNCLITGDDEFVISTQDDWESFLGYKERKLLDIDFDSEMVLGVTRGVGGCSGLGRIVNISEEEKSIVFEYDVAGIGLCEMWLVVQIFAIAEKSDKPVEFIGP